MASAELDRLVVRLIGETGQFTNSLKKAGSQVQKFTRNAEGQFVSTATKTDKAYRKIATAIDNTAKRTRKYAQQIGFDLVAKQQKFIKNIDKTTIALIRNRPRLAGAILAFRKFSLKAMGPESTAAQIRFIQGLKRIDAALLMTMARARQAQKAIGAFLLTNLGSLKSLGQGMSSLGRTLFLRLTIPLTLFGGFAARAFAKFDQAMIESTSIMKVTTEQTERMRQTAISLSGKAAKSAIDLAESYFFLASAGKDAEQSISLLPKVADFAIAGAFDMARATDLLTDAQSALGLASKDVAQDTRSLVRVSDVLVKANTLANASVEQFSTALTTKAGASLKAFNKDVEEGVAILAALADQGVKAQLAGTQLDRVIRLLSKTSQDSAKEHKQLGFRVFDTAGKMRNMGDIIGNLEDILSGMSDESKVATLSMLGFEARIQQAILPLLGTSDAIKRYERELRNAGGTTREVSEKQMKSFSNQMKLAWNTTKNFAASIGKDLAPRLLALGAWVKDMTKRWDGLDDSTKKWVISVGLAAAATGPLLIGLGAMVTLISSISLGLVGMVGVGVVPFLVALSVAMSDVNAQFAESSKLVAGSLSKRLEIFSGLNFREQEKALNKDIARIEKNVARGKERVKKAFALAPGELFENPVLTGLESLGFDPTGRVKGKKMLQQDEQFLAQLKAAKKNLFAARFDSKPGGPGGPDNSELLAEAERQAKTKEAAEKLGKSATDLLSTFQLQLATQGMLPRQAQIFALEQQNVNDTLIEQLRIQDRLITAEEKKIEIAKRITKEEERKAKSVKDQIAQIIKSNRTPEKILGDRVRELKKLNLQGLSKTEAGKETEKAFKEFQKAKGETGVGTARQTVSRGIRVGSREDFELLAKIGGVGKETTEEKALTALERLVEILENQEQAEAAELARTGAGAGA